MRYKSSYGYRMFSIFLILLITSATTYSQTQDLPKPDQKKFKLGLKHLKKNDFQFAIRCFLDVNNSSPDNIDNLYQITVTYNDHLDDFTNAVIYGTRLTEVIQNTLPTLDPKKDKRANEKYTEMLREVELLVAIAKTKVPVSQYEIEEDVVAETDAVTTTQENTTSDNINQDTIIKSSQYNSEEQVLIADIGQPKDAFEGFIELNDSLPLNSGLLSVISNALSDNNDMMTDNSLISVLTENEGYFTTYHLQNQKLIDNVNAIAIKAIDAMAKENILIAQGDSVTKVAEMLNEQNQLLIQQNDNLREYIEWVDNNTSTFIPKTSNEIYVLDSNIVRGIKKSSDLGSIDFTQEELDQIDDFLSRIENIGLTDPNPQKEDETFKEWIAKLMAIYDHQLEMIKQNGHRIDSLTNVADSLAFKRSTQFFDRRDEYELTLDTRLAYINCLIIQKQSEYYLKVEGKQYLADEIANLINDKLTNSNIQLTSLKFYSDDRGSDGQQFFSADTNLIQPIISGYKLISCVPISLNNPKDDYLAVHFALQLSFTQTESIEEADDIADYSSNIIDPIDDDKKIDENEIDNQPIKRNNYVIKTQDGINILTDPNNKQWMVLEENPSSYTSYLMFQEEPGWRLPTYNELKSVMKYLTINGNALNKLEWPKEDVIYLSNDSYYDNRNNKLYKGIKLSGNSYEDMDVQGGDEVYLIVISE